MTTATGSPAGPAVRGHLRRIAERRFERSIEAPTRFFAAHADLISRACLEMARRFQRGGRLLVFGEGAEVTDAQHVAVEFVHPVIVGKRALPAIALTNDVAALTGTGRAGPPDQVFARTLEILGREHDIAMGISGDGKGAAVRFGLARARQLGMLTLGLAGCHAGVPTGSDATDFFFVVPSDDPLVVQEVQETLYHVIWELVHLFFEHRVAE